MRDIATKVLAGAGLSVLAAEDGKKGLDLFKSKRVEIDLVLLDANLPKMSGLKVLASIRTIRPDIHVILTSGYGREAMELSAEEQGRTEFIAKPFDLEDLIGRVKRALEPNTLDPGSKNGADGKAGGQVPD